MTALFPAVLYGVLAWLTAWSAARAVVTWKQGPTVTAVFGFLLCLYVVTR